MLSLPFVSNGALISIVSVLSSLSWSTRLLLLSLSASIDILLPKLFVSLWLFWLVNKLTVEVFWVFSIIVAAGVSALQLVLSAVGSTRISVASKAFWSIVPALDIFASVSTIPAEVLTSEIVAISLKTSFLSSHPVSASRSNTLVNNLNIYLKILLLIKSGWA